MAEKARTYNIVDDVNDQRLDHLKLILWPVLFLAVIALGIEIKQVHGFPISTVIVATTLLSLVLQGSQYKNAAVWSFLAGLIALPALQIQEFGLGLTPALFMIFPIIIASLIRDREGVVNTTLLSIGLSLLSATLKTDFNIALGFTLPPAAVAAASAFAAYLNEDSIMRMVYWAMDIQSKDANRAEMFYEQKLQLGEAMLQVQHANSALEILNKQLEVAQQKAEAASQTKTIFLSNMSHELRTPLNIIIGYSSSMLNMPQMFDNVQLPEIYRPYLKLVEDNGHYLLGLINDILDLSKIEAGKLELHPEPVELPEILRGIVATSIGLLKDKPLQLRPDFSDNLPPVWADPMRIRQIALNLMSNAIKFTHTGSVTLSARVDGDFVRVSVIDTGIGIPEKSLETIFDRFQQAEQDTDKRYGGTGLGLDISKSLSIMHGGDLTVQSVINQGSTFSFTLPIMRVQEVAPDQPTTIEEQTMQAFASARESVHEMAAILLVEDEVNTREMMHKALESHGFVVVDAAEGQQALELASGLLPDLILLDAYLPGMDGWVVLETLKADPETEPIPVIMFTAAPDPQRAYDLGATLVLKKPITPEEMISSIESVLYVYPNKENLSE